MTTHGKYAQGWTGYGILGAILSAAIGALGFAGLMRLIPAEASVATPWVLVSLFILPLTYCVQLLFKVFDTTKDAEDAKQSNDKIVRI